MEEMTRAIAERVAGYRQAWADIATDGIVGFWNPDRFLFYKPEEFHAVNRDWASTLAYWRGNEALHKFVDLQFSDIVDLGMPGPNRLILKKLVWHIGFRDDATDAEGRPVRYAGRAMKGWNHVLSVWDTESDAPKLVGWLEAPDAPSIYMTDLYYAMGEQT